MAMSKKQLDRCLRCGHAYIRNLGGTAAVYCFPTPDWLRDHPDDDGKNG